MEMYHYRKAEDACRSRHAAIVRLGLESMAVMAVGKRSPVQRAAKKFLRQQGIVVAARPAAIVFREV